MARALAVSRSQLEDRAVVLGSTAGELAAGLRAVAAGQPAAGVVTGTAAGGKVVFVFPGQGGQWPGMAAGLAAGCPVFAARLADCEQALEPHTGWRLGQVLAGDGPGLDRAEVIQPVLWAVMVSLAAVWQAAGVVPDAVIGHSQGEIAAATVAGVLSLQDAARVVAVRSAALAALAGTGGMMSVAEPEGRARARLAAWAGRLSVAAVNGPAAVVVSGDGAALEELAAACAAEGMRTRRVEVDYASHCAQVEAVREDIITGLAGITPGRARVPLWSTVTGRPEDGTGLDGGYWYANLREPVRFAPVAAAVAGPGCAAFIEVSPHPVLAAGLAETLDELPAGPGRARPAVIGTLRRDHGGPGQLLAALAQAHVAGVRVDWAAVLPAAAPVDLPTYAFQHQRYWPQPAPAAGTGTGGPGPDAAEARFWAAVEREDAAAVAGTLAAGGDGAVAGPLGVVLPVLAAWRRRERAQSVVEGWRYRVCWEPGGERGGARLAGTWLVVVPAGGGGLAGRVCAVLAGGGADVVVAEVAVTAGRAVLAVVAAGVLAGRVAAGVVSLLALDESPWPGRVAVPGGLAATAALVQGLGDAGIGAPLWCLTSGAVAAGAGGVVTAPVQAQVWGLGRVAGLEHPGRWGGLVDVPPVLDERAAAGLVGVLAGGAEDQVAVRAEGVLVRRLARAPLAAPCRVWRPGGTVLVTGATGALGPVLCRWLAGRGAARLVLTGRRGPAAAGAGRLAAGLAGAGARVTVTACDVGDRAALAALVTGLAGAGEPVRSVFHAAASLELGTVGQASPAVLDGVLAAKAAGAGYLDELFGEPGLDAFVLFSSVAGVWGSAAHAGYAAGNAYLDALAARRRSRGLAATSIAWGIWNRGQPR